MARTDARSRRGILPITFALLVAGCGTGWLPIEPSAPSAPEAHELVERFDGHWVLSEAGSADESASSRWWLNSGARLEVHGGVARTVHGELGEGDPWRVRYARSSAEDTDGGRHPQNLFRLVSRDRWHDFTQEVRFRVNRVIPSRSRQRNAWSGVFLFQRYQSGATTYYSGLRADGSAVIKRKRDGTYHTLEQRAVFGSPDRYDRAANRVLLPVGRWIDMRSLVRDLPDGTVRIDLAVRDPERGEGWTLVASALDTGVDGAPIRESGAIGLRSDFMDVEFADLVVREPPDPALLASRARTP